MVPYERANMEGRERSLVKQETGLVSTKMDLLKANKAKNWVKSLRQGTKYVAPFYILTADNPP